MANLFKKLSEDKLDKIQQFLIHRFNQLKDLRDSLDDDIEEEIDIYNNVDKYIDEKEDWQEKISIPYIYTIVQTMVARLIEVFFGVDNYLRIYVENPDLKNIEKKIQRFIQAKLDKIKLKDKARDFLEDALVQRTTWLQLVPKKNGDKLEKIDLNILKWYDVWFDTKAKTTDDSDFFLRKIVKLYKILQKDKIYFNLDKVKQTKPPEEDIREKQEYEAKQGNSNSYEKVYYDPNSNSTIDEVELLEWYGMYDISEDKDKPNYQFVLFVLANRELLVRAETVELETEKKMLLFPIRPLKQANSLIGKSVPQLTKDMQYELNEVKSLRMENFKTQIRLLFKYRRDSGIDFDELFVEGGNAIGYDLDPKDIDMFPIPDKIREASIMSSELVQDMQQVTGAVDYLMGTSAARGVTETASGIQQITEQALYKFSMMAHNVYSDLLDMINYIIILHIIYGTDEILLKDMDLKKFTEMTIEDLEDSYSIDIALNDLAMRRDIERSQFIQAMNIILGILQQVGGNPKELLKQVMERLNMENIEDILKLPPEQEQIIQQILPIVQQNPQILQMMMQMVEGAGGGGGSMMANAQAPKQSRVEEEAFGVNIPK